MKKILIMLVCIIAGSLYANCETTKFQTIDFDYSKLFYINQIAVDFNSNGTLEDDELFILPDDKSVLINFDYKDFGTAGNRIAISYCLPGEPQVNSRFENITFLYKKTKTDTIYCVYDALGDSVMFIWKKEGDVKWRAKIDNILVIIEK